jgi:aspartate kinase
MKFGGSSVADADRIKHVAEIIKLFVDKKPLVVTSAMGKTTDKLLHAVEQALVGNISIDEIKESHYAAAEKLNVDKNCIEPLLEELCRLLSGVSLIKELSLRTRDYLVSFGERLAVRIIAAYLSQTGIKAKAFDAWDIGFTSNSNFTDSEILDETYHRINDCLGNLGSDYAYTPLITGFIAKDVNGNITTLGRGGSDLTASVLGAALNVDEIQVWKDVDGILTTDPRIVSSAKPVKNVSFEEASELAYFGAKVLHPRSILPAMAKNIPVRVKNSYNPDHEGTLILSHIENDSELLRVLTFKKHVTLVDIVSTRMLGQYGFLAKVFQIFDEQEVSVDMLATSEVSISVTLDSKVRDMDSLRAELEKVARVTIKNQKTIVTMIGNVGHSSEIMAKTFEVLKQNAINVQMISQGASKVNISFIVDDSEAEKCIKALHKAFFENSQADF